MSPVLAIAALDDIAALAHCPSHIAALCAATRTNAAPPPDITTNARNRYAEARP